MIIVAAATVLQIPESLDDVPLVDEALASAAYTNTGSSSRTPSRKTRWTNEQIEALVEGVEKYGLSAWRTIVMVGRGMHKEGFKAAVEPRANTWSGLHEALLMRTPDLV